MEIEAAQIFIVANGGAGGFHQQEAQQTVALLGDVAEALGVAAGMFFGIQAAVGGDAAGAIEAGDRLESVHHGQGSQQTDAGMGAQANDTGIVLRALF